MTSDLAERYGTHRRGRRTAIVVASVVVAAAFLGWLAWATWFHSNPAVESDLATYKVVDQHEASAVVDVVLADDARDPSCRLRALAEDHSVVGELAFTPTDGRNTVSVRTERVANPVDLLGCSAEGQPRPQ